MAKQNATNNSGLANLPPATVNGQPVVYEQLLPLLGGSLGGSLTGFSVAESTVPNSTAETDLLNQSIGGANVAVGDVYHATALFELTQNSGAAVSGNVRLRLGSTLIGSSGDQSITTAANVRRCYIDLKIQIKSATRISYTCVVRVGIGTNSNEIANGNTWDFTGSATLNTTSLLTAQQLRLTWQWVTATPQVVLETQGGWVCLGRINGTPGGAGDMQRSVYDTDDDGIVDAAESVPWGGITGVPATFPPSTHGHTVGEVTNLQTLLDSKADVAHNHTSADLTDFNASVTARINAASVDALSDVSITTPAVGQILKFNGTNWVNDTDNVGSVLVYPAYTTGQFFDASVTGTPPSTGTFTAGVLRAYLLNLETAQTVDFTRINCTTGVAGGSMRYALYNVGPGRYPTTQIFESGLVDCAVAAGKPFTLPSPIALNSGLYAVAWAPSTGTTLAARQVPATNLKPLPVEVTQPTTRNTLWTVNFTYGALPATFPAGATAISGAGLQVIFRVT